MEKSITDSNYFVIKFLFIMFEIVLPKTMATYKEKNNNRNSTYKGDKFYLF